MYEIGIYNKMVDDMGLLKDCVKVFDVSDFSSFKKYVRKNDAVAICSEFSLYGLDVKDILTLKEEYNLNIKCLSNKNIDTNNVGGNFGFQMNVTILEFIKNEKDRIKKIISI